MSNIGAREPLCRAISQHYHSEVRAQYCVRRRQHSWSDGELQPDALCRRAVREDGITAPIVYYPPTPRELGPEQWLKVSLPHPNCGPTTRLFTSLLPSDSSH